MDQPPDPDRRRSLTGILYALAAFGTWGLVAPVHFKLIAAVPPFEVLAQRIVWSTLLVLAIIGLRRRWAELARALLPRRPLAMLCLSALLVAGNWLVYIWAISTGRLVEASLGYFINPLVNVVLGIVFLGERLRPLQLAACGIAAAGVLVLTLAAGTVPWIALALGISFGFYGLIRKTVRVDPLIGFTVESLLLVPFAATYVVVLVATGASAFARGDLALDVLLVLTAVTTSAPLIWFASAAQRLKLSTVGLLQYLAPSCLLALGVFAYGEPFTTVRAVAFAAIWTALALYSADAFAARERKG
ncbi:MAG TPA: EamA family transporter RarD [Beijerinckiaceae bacterium]|jgi:chloramphenicol-sensitive protein RarD